MATLHFDLVSPERVLFSGELDAVLLPGEEGEMTVLPGHAPLMSVLKAGFVVMTGVGHTGSRVLVRGGFAEINPERVTVLAERATAIEDLTPDSIEREILSLRQARDGSDDPEAKRAADALIGQLEEARAMLQF
jgi:F-type H+-transporting ATPase subunit epsilon